MRAVTILGALLCVVAVAGCGGGGGSGDGGSAGGGGGGGGGGFPFPGEPIAAGSDPLADVQAAPLPLEARAPAPTVCVHTGGGDEYNVGGPGANPNREEEIIDIPWELLEAGDTVRIHWRAEPYRARIALFRSGTADQPIRVCGVPGPAGERPHITGDGAFTRAGPDFATGIPGALQTYGVMTISGRDFDSRVEHVIVEGLRIGDTKDGPGRVDVPEDDAPFTDASGTPRQYESAAACIRMRQAHHITLRNNEITNCGDGIFAGSVPDSENHIIRNLLVEGNHIHDNAIIGDESRHQAYLQGVDITVQFNYFGPVRTRPEGVASGNQLKMRAAGLVVRYNYLRNGARALDLVEAEEHIPYLAPWQYQRLRSQYLACQVEGCLKLTAAELAQYDARQRADWAKYQHAYVYGNLIHVVGRDDGATLLPSNLVHYGFDNSQHDRQPGTLWFFHNTVLWQTDRDALRVARLFDYGSDFGDAGYYDYDPDLLNFGGALHYITENNDDATCRQPAAGCTNWGPMLQRRVEHFGRMRAFHNALVRVPFTPGGAASDFELTRNRWDQLELLGPTWLSQGWDTDSDGDTLGGGFGQRRLPDSHVYQGGNDAHHVTGLAHVRSSGGVPIATDTMAPTAGSALRGAAGSWPSVLADVLRPGFSITVDPAQPGRVLVAPRVQWSTVGASE